MTTGRRRRSFLSREMPRSREPSPRWKKRANSSQARASAHGSSASATVMWAWLRPTSARRPIADASRAPPSPTRWSKAGFERRKPKPKSHRARRECLAGRTGSVPGSRTAGAAVDGDARRVRARRPSWANDAAAATVARVGREIDRHALKVAAVGTTSVGRAAGEARAVAEAGALQARADAAVNAATTAVCRIVHEVDVRAAPGIVRRVVCRRFHCVVSSAVLHHLGLRSAASKDEEEKCSPAHPIARGRHDPRILATGGRSVNPATTAGDLPAESFRKSGDPSRS